MADALFNCVDCIILPVDDLEAALEFYRDKLGHKLVWRTETQAGLAFGDGVTELVLRQDDPRSETDIKVESAVEAAERFQAAGGVIVAGPFDIRIGKCVVVRDPWGNHLVLLDSSKGLLKTNEDGYVIS
ncbi:MAG TPA: VOC family protein [Armatimonadota bacterium]|nr:VOC family protein [Armatimonadota bacterium]